MENQEELLWEEPAESAEKPAEEIGKPDFESFVRQYPDVEPETVPQSVWDAVLQGRSMLEAYQGHELQQLKQQISELNQQTQARARSLGSVRSAGKALPTTDGFLRGFDEA